MSVDTMKLTPRNGLCLGSTENSQQTDEIFRQLARDCVPKCGCFFESPGIVFVDGHSTHVTRTFIDFAADNGLYVLVEPSYMSMISQVADVGINIFLKNRYYQEYSSIFCVSSVTGRILADTE